MPYTGGGASVTAANTWTSAQTFSARIQVAENNGISLGSTDSGNNGYIFTRTAQTPDSPILATGTLSNAWLITENGDVSFDFAVAQRTNPTLAIMSAVQSTEQRMFLHHNQTQAMVEDGANTAANRRPIGFQGGSAVASAGTITPTGNVFHVTGTTNITNVTIMAAGTIITIIFDGILTFTDGGNLKIVGNQTTAANSTITLVSDGTNWFEIARSAPG